MIGKKVPPAVGKKIFQIVHDKGDRVFVKVAHNAADKLLVSHDQAAFPDNAKKQLKNEIGVDVKNAKAAGPLL
jgi:hypothetical protein